MAVAAIVRVRRLVDCLEGIDGLGARQGVRRGAQMIRQASVNFGIAEVSGEILQRDADVLSGGVGVVNAASELSGEIRRARQGLLPGGCLQGLGQGFRVDIEIGEGAAAGHVPDEGVKGLGRASA